MIKVLLFANIREIIQKPHIFIQATTIHQLLEMIKFAYPNTIEPLNSCVISVNQNIINDSNYILNENDAVAIIPPISSG
jgi:molybdopterin converting factor small subunit